MNISAGGVLPMCQDTGTAIVMGKKSEGVLTGVDDGEAISRGVYDAYTKLNLRYSQLAPITTWEEKNTGTNLPAQIELYSTPSSAGKPEYKFLFMAKGGGSANKSFLFQETKAVLNPTRMLEFLDEKIRSLGTAACPPYHLAVVIGGTSAEFALKTAKYASAHYLDNLPTSGTLDAHGFRDLELEEEVFKLTQSFGIGAQFGGQVLLPRRARRTTPPARRLVPGGDGRLLLGRPPGARQDHRGRACSSSSWRPTRPATSRRRPRAQPSDDADVVKIDLNRPMDEILAELGRAPGQDATVADRSARRRPRHRPRQDQGTARRGRGDAGVPPRPRGLLRRPGQDAEGYASGSFGPTTAGRMDSYVEQFQAAGGSKVMLAKGNRSKVVTEACHRHGGFYLGSIGGPAARLAQDCIKSVDVLEYPELGMEAVWKIEVEDFPAFIVVDDKGNDFFTDPSGAVTVPITGVRVRSAEK